MELHKLIKQYRKSKHITQAEIAEDLHVTQAYICAIEKGTAGKSIAQLKEVIESLGGTLLIQLANQGITPHARHFIETSSSTPEEMQKIGKAFNTDVIFKIK
jgi:transcriptional regulator with XRE-family HTH domain